jgi:transcriptional regulator with XRE-family HTH domain
MLISKEKRNSHLQKGSMKLKEIFIRNLRICRKYNKISQKVLAQMCGTSTSYIGQIEIGNRFPSLDLIEKIASALGIKPYILFFDDLEEKSLKKHKRLVQHVRLI